MREPESSRDRSSCGRRAAGLLRPAALLAITCGIGLAAPWSEAAGQATPTAPPGVTARTTALLVSSIHDPLRVIGSDGLVHLEYDLVFTNVFTDPVTIESIEVSDPNGGSLHQLSGETLRTMTQPLLGATPTEAIPASGAVAVQLDVVVPPDQTPERLTHRITYRLAPDARLATIIGTEEIVGPELAVDPLAPIVIAPPLRGSGWVNGNGCCGPSDHRSARLGVDGSHLVKPETFAIDWVQLEGNRLFTGDGADPTDYFGFGAEVLAVADGAVVFVRDGLPEETPFLPPVAVRQSLDFAGNEVVLEIAPGIFAIYAHLQPGSIQVHEGQTVTTGQVLGLLGNTGNSVAPHLHFQIADGPDIMTSNSLPFVLEAWTKTGAADLDDIMGEIPVTGSPRAQHMTFPLELDVAVFP